MRALERAGARPRKDPKGTSAPTPTAPRPPEQPAPPPGRCPVLVGGVGPREQGDASFGVVAVDVLSEHRWPCGTEILDLGDRVVDASEALLAAAPPFRKAVLLGGVSRERRPGRCYPRAWQSSHTDSDDVGARIRQVGQRGSHLDDFLVVAEHFGALPSDVAILEVEPVRHPSDPGLSPEAEALLPEVIRWVQREVAAVTHAAGVSPILAERSLE